MKNTSLCLLGLVLLSAASGVVSGGASPESTLAVVNALVGVVLALVLVLLWLRFDAQQHDFRLRAGMILLIIVLGIVGIPLYLISSRGAKGGLIAIALTGGFFLLNIAVALAFSIPIRILVATI